MAADPGFSSDTPPSYHLFLSCIPNKIPKEEVEAVLGSQLRDRGVRLLLISVVPQSAWKNKGFGFVVLDGCPEETALISLAASLDGQLHLGGKNLKVAVFKAPESGGTPSTTGPPTSWDQPPEKIARLCALILHLFFARRAHLTEFRAERLLKLLSCTVAPSCGQAPKQVALWGRDIYGSLEAMFLAFGDSYFGGGWSLSGTVADRTAVLNIGKFRHMQGWDCQRDPLLPIASLLRVSACKQRQDVDAPDASSGFSTPTVCRRFSDCGSLSFIHSTEQPSCSQSEASWSLGSTFVAVGSGGALTSYQCSPSLSTPSNGSEAPVLFSAACASPNSWGSFKSLDSCSGSEAVDIGQPSAQQSDPLDRRSSAAAGPATAAQTAVCCERNGQQPSCREEASCSGRGPAAAAVAAAATATAARQRGRELHTAAAAAAVAAPAATQSAPRPRRRGTSSLGSGLQSPHHLSGQVPVGNHIGRSTPSSTCVHMQSVSVPPTAQDLLSRCACHLRRLFSLHPGQGAFPLAEILKLLSEAPDVVSWGTGGSLFSLEGYAHAVYGTFEKFLSKISRAYFADGLYFDGGHREGEPRCLCLALRSVASTPNMAAARTPGAGVRPAVSRGGWAGARGGERWVVGAAGAEA